ncbi:archaellin/type IV pilin N-terminal domain-containing protein [Methanosarcina sp. 2.H.A.1B.4]|uniref:archaellin/type IV pilin N-terminal domain-containing protein n=1 Tax=Methanosarcina sp. 2.H.A.1B.4 TaxID=1483600 RepID=UPI0006213E05|nr:archaellin/type IV pilin N-terminal domain-containing protein [Methanosarcina sp. 2.H.A.1B.4]KKG10373.1 flagellin [Methanosarcina sp. 2.H.A.1B.4]
MWNKIFKDEKGFTGLEAAIVLVAFVVVAAVFSYVMLGAGFYTTQKSQEVVHTGVQQASSSVELSGDVIAKGDGTELKNITMFLQLTSGGSAVDMGQTLIVFTAPKVPPTDLNLSTTASNSTFKIVQKFNDEGNQDNIINRFEKFEVLVNVDAITDKVSEEVGPNDMFQVEIKPPQGAAYTIHRQAPPSISAIMTLV